MISIGENEMRELKPCPAPWCAESKPALMQGGFRNSAYVVRCETCGCSTPRFYEPSQARAIWNHRPEAADKLESLSERICEMTSLANALPGMLPPAAMVDDEYLEGWVDAMNYARHGFASLTPQENDGDGE
jgi:hypothetical protein